MQLSDLNTNLRSLVNQQSSTAILLDSEITRFLNNRYNYIVSRIIDVEPSYFGVIDQTIDLVNGTDNYALPDLDSDNNTRVERILHVKIAYDGTNFHRARRINYIELVDTNFQNVAYTQANPVYYLTNTQIYLLPTPSAAATNGIKLWYAQRPAELSADTDVPAFSALYHHILPYGAAADFLRKEGDVGDFSLIRDHEEQFRTGVEDLLSTIQPRDVSYPEQVVNIDDVVAYDYYPELYVPPGSLSA